MFTKLLNQIMVKFHFVYSRICLITLCDYQTGGEKQRHLLLEKRVPLKRGCGQWIQTVEVFHWKFLFTPPVHSSLFSSPPSEQDDKFTL